MARGWRWWVGGGFGLALALAAFEVVRWNAFANEGRRLVADAMTLPRVYTAGTGRPLRMVVLGDSTAMGVGAGSLEATLPYRVALGLGGRMSVTNLAVSGERVGGVLRDQLPRVIAGADWALVTVSANDATHGTSSKAFEQALRALLDGLEARGLKRVILSTTPNFRTTPALPWMLSRVFERRAADLTHTIRRVAERYPFVWIADLNVEGTLSEDEYAADGFHPNAAGYAAWAGTFVRSSGSPQ